jgi:hypothetical protein
VNQGGLTWMPVTFTMSWLDATSYCARFNGLGQTGWRLPEIGELQNLYASGVMKDLRWVGVWSVLPYGAGYHYYFLVGDYAATGEYYPTEDTSGEFVACVR